MRRRSKWMFMVIGIAACFAITVCSAYEIKPVDPSANCERDVLGVCMLPPLPPPTAEQLRKGKELLDKITYLIDNVPLTDEVAVMKVFGFTDLYAYESLGYKQYPPYRDAGPKGKHGGFMQPQEFSGTGFTNLRLQAWIKSSQYKESANLHAGFNTDEVCISIEDVRVKFVTKSKTNRSHLIADIHPTARPPRLHHTGHLVFSEISALNATPAEITFTFDYQLCAKSLGASYHNN